MLDIILNKKESIERAISQIRKYYKKTNREEIKTNYMIQDAISMNLQRLCESCIDMANHVVKTKKLGIPKSSAHSFEILNENNIISADILENLKKMTAFRNVLVHEYQKLDINILTDIIENHLDEIIDYTNQVLKAVEP